MWKGEMGQDLPGPLLGRILERRALEWQRRRDRDRLDSLEQGGAPPLAQPVALQGDEHTLLRASLHSLVLI